MLLLTEDVFNQTVNLINGAHNVKPILLYVFNVKLTLTELSSSQNIFVFVLMVSIKLLMELVNNVQMDVLNVHLQPIVLLVLLKLHQITMEPVNVLKEPISVLQPTVLDIANNVFNIVINVQMV